MKKVDVLRIIRDNSETGVVNMATDEAILWAVNQGKCPATLRFYRWAEPTISLGYFQKYEQLHEQDQVIAQLPVVRRQTGGGAILHDDELTYSLVLGLEENAVFRDIESVYRLVHDVFIEQLGRLDITADYRGGNDQGNSQRGPFFCFARQHRLDVMIGQGKLLGSAQRRIKNAVLQHGSLILQRHFAQQPAAQVGEALNQTACLESFMEQVSARLGDALGLTSMTSLLTAEERQRAEELTAKYAGDAWNRLR